MRKNAGFVRWIATVALAGAALFGSTLLAQAQEAAAPAAAPAAAAPAAGAPAAAAPAAGTMSLDPAAAPAAEHTMSFKSIVFGSVSGAFIWLLLIGCSVIGGALIVDSFLNISEKKIAPDLLVSGVREAMEQGDLLKAMKRCEEVPGPLANILSAGFGNVKEGFEVVQDAVSVAADMESEKLMQKVTYLSVISNATPMLGLIGTVQGMIHAFFNLGTMAAGAQQQAMLAVNISHGLWATAVGLTVAVITTVFFYVFKNKATRIILGMEAMTLDLIKTLRNVEVVEE